MKTYRVKEYFTEDYDHAYFPGDTYPRKGLTVSEQRLKELSTPFNAQQKILIVENKPDKKHSAYSDERNEADDDR